MRTMSDNFNKEECIENVSKALGLESLEELPHYDTVNDFLSELDVEELEKIRTHMIKELLKKRKLKQTFKRLPICILGDSLYACESVFSRCGEYKWKYLCRFKEWRIKSIASEFKALKEIEQSKKQADLFWTNDISYNERTVNLMETKLETKNGKSQGFVFIGFLFWRK